MIEESVIDQLITFATSGAWPQLVGAVLLAAVAILNIIAARARWKGLKARVVDVCSLVAAVVGALLVDGSVWYRALIIGLVGGGSGARGLWELIGDLAGGKPAGGGVPPTGLDNVPTPKATPIPRPTAFMGLLIGIAVFLVGCSGAPIVPDPNPGDGIDACSLEDSIVEGLASAVDDVDEVLPDDAPKATDGLAYARGAVEEGRGAVAVCQALVAEGRSGLSAVIPWISAAAHIVRGLITILTAADVGIPESILSVLHSLGLAQAELGVDVELEVVAKGGPS